MKLDDTQKFEVREMARSNPGWKIVNEWCKIEVEHLVKQLIQENNEDVRGKIKGIKLVLNKVNSILKK